MENLVYLSYKMGLGEIYYYTLEIENLVKTSRAQTTEKKTYTEIDLSQKVIGIDEAGNITLQISADLSQSPIIKIKKTGEIIQSDNETPFSQPPLPQHGIKKGDTWEGICNINVPIQNNPVSLKYNYTYEKNLKINNYDCIQINVTCPATEILLSDGAKQVIGAAGVTYFAPDEGILIGSEVETKTTINMSDSDWENLIKVKLSLKEIIHEG